mmetsp:Transcript_8623/g.27009  ORF Transcript_8623/g.27009 Transcript_8623/m.27009 type:complete len:244 (-) Transcript_8623:731-1462(-)
MSLSSSAFSFSLSTCSADSCSCLRASVTAIMFSLTTAVRMDSMAHSLIITKIMNTTFVIGSEFSSGSRMLLWPSITVNSTKMLSGTELKISATSSGGLSLKTSPSLNSFTERRAKKYSTTIVRTNTQTMPAIACAMPLRRLKSCGTCRTSRTSRSTRNSRAIRRMTMKWPILPNCPDAGFPLIMVDMNDKAGTNHWSRMPPTTTMKSSQFHNSSVRSQKKRSPAFFSRTASSRVKIAKTTCSQ